MYCNNRQTTRGTRGKIRNKMMVIHTIVHKMIQEEDYENLIRYIHVWFFLDKKTLSKSIAGNIMGLTKQSIMNKGF